MIQRATASSIGPACAHGRYCTASPSYCCDDRCPLACWRFWTGTRLKRSVVRSKLFGGGGTSFISPLICTGQLLEPALARRRQAKSRANAVRAPSHRPTDPTTCTRRFLSRGSGLHAQPRLDVPCLWPLQRRRRMGATAVLSNARATRFRSEGSDHPAC